MKKILIIIALAAVSCKKETQCYICQWTSTDGSHGGGYTVCTTQPGTSTKKDSAGNTITTVCKLKN